MVATSLGFKVNLGAQQWLDTLATPFLVKLDGSEQVVEISDGKGRVARLPQRL